METKQVTIFGGSGFLGRYAVRTLAKKSWRIMIACRHPNRAFFLRPLGQVGQIGFVKCDIARADEVGAALKGSHAAINLAGILCAKGQAFENVHVAGAENVAKSAAWHKLEALVHVSALGADSESESEYAQTKGNGEAGVLGNFPTATILRPSLMFGPEDRFFNRFASLARFLPALPLIGGGGTRFQPVFVGDVAQAIAASLEQPEAQGRTYELGGPATYSFKELMQVMLGEIGRRRLLLPLPFRLATLIGFFMQLGPKPLLTPDQVRLLRRDNVVSATAHVIAELGIVPTTVEAEVPAYLWRFRPKGEYSEISARRHT